VAKNEKFSLDGLLEQVLIKDEDKPYEVPSNWVWTRLEFIGDVRGGKRLPQGCTLLDEITPYPYLRVVDFGDRTINTAEIKFLDESTYGKISNYTISNQDVYISIAGTIGKVGIIQDDLSGANLTENAAKITKLNHILKEYLCFVLCSSELQTQIIDSSTTTTQSKLALFRIGRLIIPLPPLPEQQRIVDLMELLFEKLDRAKELVQNALDSFNERKSVILHLAFTGELTAKWREENGVTYEKDWEIKEFGDLIKEGPQNGLYKPQSAYGSGSLIVRIDNFYDGKINPWNTLKRLRLEQNEITLYGLNNNDLLINRVNSIQYLGKSALVSNLEETCVFESNVMRMNLKDSALSEYIIMYLNSTQGLQELRKNAKHAVNQASINQKDVNMALVPLPTVKEQKEVVRILNNLLDNEQKASELCDVIENINFIKKSILARAFRGELSTNNPNEESPLELLKEVLTERIQD